MIMSDKCSDCGEELSMYEICFCALMDDEVTQYIPDWEYKDKKKECTCGGTKCKTTHSAWCDING